MSKRYFLQSTNIIKKKKNITDITVYAKIFIQPKNLDVSKSEINLILQLSFSCTCMSYNFSKIADSETTKPLLQSLD